MHVFIFSVLFTNNTQKGATTLNRPGFVVRRGLQSRNYSLM